jgi:hypothetical protein
MPSWLTRPSPLAGISGQASTHGTRTHATCSRFILRYKLTNYSERAHKEPTISRIIRKGLLDAEGVWAGKVA